MHLICFKNSVILFINEKIVEFVYQLQKKILSLPLILKSNMIS